MTLVEFLTAMLDADSAVARAAGPGEDDWDDSYFAAKDLHDLQPHTSMCGWRVGEGLDSECSCGYPARVLREVEAKRAIVRDAVVFDDQYEGGGLRMALRYLAAVYSDSPDYDESWKP